VKLKPQWRCPLCEFEMPDDGSTGDAQLMADHIRMHEQQESDEFRKWREDGMPATEEEWRAAYHAILCMRAFRAFVPY